MQFDYAKLGLWINLSAANLDIVFVESSFDRKCLVSQWWNNPNFDAGFDIYTTFRNVLDLQNPLERITNIIYI